MSIEQQFTAAARKFVWELYPAQLVRYFYHSKDLPTFRRLAPLLLARSLGTKDEVAAVNIQGLILLIDGNYEAAVEKFKQANNLDPRYVRVYMNWGYALAQMPGGKNYQEAIEKYQKAIELDLRYAAAAYYGWGVVHAHQGSILAHENKCEKAVQEFDEAINKFKQTVISNPNFAPVYYVWGSVLHEQANVCPAQSDREENYQNAMENYEKAIERDPDFVFPYVTWGVILAELGDYRSAIQKYEKAAQLPDVYPRVYYYWAEALVEEDKCDEALEKYSKFAESLAVSQRPPFADKCPSINFERTD